MDNRIQENRLVIKDIQYFNILFLYFINYPSTFSKGFGQYLQAAKRLVLINPFLSKLRCISMPVFSDGQETDSAGQLPFADQQEIIEYFYCCFVKNGLKHSKNMDR